VVDNEGNNIEEKIGNLVIDSPGNFMGYLNKPEETAEVKKYGGVFVGDKAIKEQGIFYVLGRESDYQKLRDGEFHHIPTMAERLKGRYINVAIATEVESKTVAVVTIDYNPAINEPLLKSLGITDRSENKFYDSRLVRRIEKETLATMSKIERSNSVNGVENFDHVLYYRPPLPQNKELTSGAPKIIDAEIKRNCMGALKDLVLSNKKFGVYNPNKS